MDTLLWGNIFDFCHHNLFIQFPDFCGPNEQDQQSIAEDDIDYSALLEHRHKENERQHRFKKNQSHKDKLL